jgi:hydrogenase maturation protein HypF
LRTSSIKKNKTKSLIASKFHNTIINCIFALSNKIRKERKINKVALSGGSFQNAYILEKIEQLLEQNGFEVYAHKKVPTNDAGIALGQLAIAAKRREIEKVNKEH